MDRWLSSEGHWNWLEWIAAGGRRTTFRLRINLHASLFPKWPPEMFPIFMSVSSRIPHTPGLISCCWLWHRKNPSGRGCHCELLFTVLISSAVRGGGGGNERWNGIDFYDGDRPRILDSCQINRDWFVDSGLPLEVFTSAPPPEEPGKSIWWVTMATLCWKLKRRLFLCLQKVQHMSTRGKDILFIKLGEKDIFKGKEDFNC